MDTYGIVSIIMNVILGGGCCGSLLALRAARRKAKAEARQAEENAEGTELDNEQKAAGIVMEYIVKPLKAEMTSLRREVTKFRKAVEKIPACPYANECPVSLELSMGDEDEAARQQRMQ